MHVIGQPLLNLRKRRQSIPRVMFRCRVLGPGTTKSSLVVTAYPVQRRAVSTHMKCAVCLKDGHAADECPSAPKDLGKREFSSSERQDKQKKIDEVEESFVDKLLSVLGKIPFALDAAAMYYCLRDPATPFWVKASIAGALTYFISPVDAIPDVIPIVGYADDAAVVYTCMAIIHSHIKPEHIAAAKKLLNQKD